MQRGKTVVNIGLIGAGWMGATHAEAYAKIEGAHIRSVASLHVERARALAAPLGAQAVADPEAILADPAIDLVDVTAPTALHARYAIAALQQGKHVLVEKPMALTLDEADAMIAAMHRSGKRLVVGHVLRFLPKFEALHEILASGRLGPARFASAMRLSCLPPWAGWFQNPQESGGAVLDLHIHDIDLLNWFFGVPTCVQARGARDRTGGWNHVVTLLDYAGLSAAAETSWMLPQGAPFTAGLRVVCENGALEYHFRASTPLPEAPSPFSFVCVYEPDRPARLVTVEPGDMYERQLAYVVECVRSGQEPARLNVQDARLALQVALAARTSLESGAAVQL